MQFLEPTKVKSILAKWLFKIFKSYRKNFNPYKIHYQICEINFFKYMLIR